MASEQPDRETIDVPNGNKPQQTEDNVPDEPKQEEKQEEEQEEETKIDEPPQQLLPHNDDQTNFNTNNNNKLMMDDGQTIILNDNVITTDGGTLSYFGDPNHDQLSIRIIDTEEIKGKILKHTSFIIESAINNNNTVSRRYNDFKWLQNVLAIEFLCIFIPPIPPPSTTSNILKKFDSDFVSQRRYDLERFLNRVSDNKLLSKSEAFDIFLTQQSQQRFEEQKKSIRVCFEYIFCCVFHGKHCLKFSENFVLIFMYKKKRRNIYNEVM